MIPAGFQRTGEFEVSPWEAHEAPGGRCHRRARSPACGVADLRTRPDRRRYDARPGGQTGQASGGPRSCPAPPRRARRAVAGRLPRTGRRAQLLGLVVHAVPGGGAAARADAEAARRPRHRAGRDLQGLRGGLAQVRAQVRPHLPQPARRPPPARPALRHFRTARDVRHRPARADRRALAGPGHARVPRPRGRQGAAVVRRLATMLALLAALGAPAAAMGASASFNDVEDELMCDTCNVPLDIAQSPRADQERREIRALIAQGMTKRQIEDDLVRRYGAEILADPPKRGFSLAVWIVPVV